MNKITECTLETRDHVVKVQKLILDIISRLQHRLIDHDDSKFGDDELPLFSEETPKLRKMTFNSDEYKESLARLKPALDHHYALNRHHPEHFKNGIEDMSLMDLIEMLCDWMAASERQRDGNIRKSLETNSQRFKIDSMLIKILENTVNELKA